MTMSPVTSRHSWRDNPYHQHDDDAPFDEDDGYSVGGYVVKRRHSDNPLTRSHPWKKPTPNRTTTDTTSPSDQYERYSAARKYRELSTPSSRRRVSPPPSRDHDSNARKSGETPAPHSPPPPPPPSPMTPPTPAPPHDRYAVRSPIASPAAAPVTTNSRRNSKPADKPLTADCHWVAGDKHTSPPISPPRTSTSSKKNKCHPVTPPGGDYLPSKFRSKRDGSSLSRKFHDEFLNNYSKITKEPAYHHAQNAGILWQTLVGQHVKFPKHWWNGARSPTMGLVLEGNHDCPEDKKRRLYKYIARHRVYSNPTFCSLVKNRGSSGRLLLHVIIRSSRTNEAIQDVVVGCFHPNARGVRATPEADMKEEDCRVIWMATRKRMTEQEEDVSLLIDPLLTRGRTLSELANESPLGDKKWVSNMNMREVFGEKPPVQTVCITEIDLDEIMIAAEEQNSFAAPALVLLREYLFP